MPGQDLYAILDLPHGASISEVKKAYKRLARKFHPDLNPGDNGAENRFKEISEAYATLSDPEKKEQYDTYGRVGNDGQQAGSGVDFTGFDFNAGPSAGFEDLFETFMHTAQSRGRSGPVKGDDLIFPLSLSLKEAYSGKKTRLTINHTVTCDACKGEGRISPSRPGPCGQCGGTGKTGLSRGPFSFSRACPACGGTGRDPGEVCRTCGGRGAREASETVDVTIPAGVDTGSRVRLRGKGQAGARGGQPGDLFIETHISPDPVFTRVGPNLRVKVPITVTEAVLGDRIEVPTLSGAARLKIPPGTSSGQVFRLKERGMPSLRQGLSGDLLVEVNIVTPKVVDERSKELLREFDRLNPENPRQYTGNTKG
jgi:molecular chaperone DnaJ